MNGQIPDSPSSGGSDPRAASPGATASGANASGATALGATALGATALGATASGKALRVTARMLQIIVACVFIVAAVLKAFDPPAFADEIRQYGILPSLADVAAWCFITAEILLASALLVNLWTRAASWLTIAMLGLFIGITIHGMVAGLTGSCGCFGNLVHRSPTQVITEDALMLVALLVALLLTRRDALRTTPPKLAFVTTMGVAALLLTGFSERLPVDNLATALAPGRRIDAWPVEGLYRDLTKGTHVVFLFSLDEPTIEADVAMMSTIAQSPGVTSPVALITDGSARLTELTFQYGISFPAGAAEPRFARSLYRTLPRTFILHDGVVEETWTGIPTPAEVSAALAALPAPDASKGTAP